jgi:hypothetical protein
MNPSKVATSCSRTNGTTTAASVASILCRRANERVRTSRRERERVNTKKSPKPALVREYLEVEGELVVRDVGLDQVDAHILPGDQVKQLAAHRPLQVLHYRSQRQNLEWGKKKKISPPPPPAPLWWLLSSLPEAPEA